MSESLPIACSLNASDLRARLALIAEVGAASLVDRRYANGRHTLWFRPDGLTRAQLQEIVAAEAECCSFLDLSLRLDDEELVLTIAAPDGADPVAAELAAAFGGPAQ